MPKKKSSTKKSDKTNFEVKLATEDEKTEDEQTVSCPHPECLKLLTDPHALMCIHVFCKVRCLSVVYSCRYVHVRMTQVHHK